MVDDGVRAQAHVDKFKVLIFPNIAALSNAQCDQVRAYVARGGSIVATYETSLYDEWGVRRKDFGLSDLFRTFFEGTVDARIQNSSLRLGKVHPILAGLEDTERIINGVSRVHTTANDPNAPLTLIP